MKTTFYKTSHLTPMQKGRLKKCLKRKFKTDNQIKSLEKIIESTVFKFKDNNNHYVEYNDSSFIEVPKLVYDAIHFKVHANLPEKAKPCLELTYSNNGGVINNDIFYTEKELITFVKTTFKYMEEVNTLDDVMNEGFFVTPTYLTLNN